METIFAQQDSLAAIFILVAELIVAVMAIMATWVVYEKAGQPGWASIVPIYNMLVLLRIAGRPAWWLLLLMVPVVNVFVTMMLCMDLAVAFNKGIGFAAGLFFLSFIFFPILAFGDAEYGRAAAH